MKFAVCSLRATWAWLCLALLCAGIVMQRRAGHVAPRALPSTAAQVSQSYGKLPLSFEANQGQADTAVKYLARGYGYDLALTDGGATLNLQREQKQARVQMRLVNAKAPKRISGADALPGKVNYLLGDDAQQWRTDVPTYAKVEYEAVYPGVDLVWYGNQQQLEYDFVVAPGADPRQIKLAFQGVQTLRLDESGDLLLTTAAGEVRQHRPVIYQEVNGRRQTINGGYHLANANEITFEIGAYDTSRPLVIDPVLSYSTLLASGATSVTAPSMWR